MASRNKAIALGEQLRTLFEVGALGSMPDAALLEHFGRGGEASEAAFATLVERHGPLVLRVCRQLLADGHLAEDAFQVTFLLLARRARSIHDPDALAGWLFRVARRVALRARAGVHRRQERERPELGEIAVGVDNRVERDELCAVVHEEIDRLGNAQRLPILLCALEGLSHEEAAKRLRWPVGTVKSRLVRGRRRLEGRLVRRGLAPALALAAGVAENSAAAAASGTTVAVPLALSVATTRAAMPSAGGTATLAGAASGALSASTASLFQNELSAMFLAKIKLVAGAGLAAGAAVVLIGMTLAGALGRRAQGIEPQIPGATTPSAKSSVAPGSDLTRAHPTDRGLPESPSIVPAQENTNPVVGGPEGHPSAFGQEVERTIRKGLQFLNTQQHDNGAWADVTKDDKTGPTSLVTLALLAAGEKPDSPVVSKALAYLRGFGPNDLNSTYAISLQTQVFAAAEPKRDQSRIVVNVTWLESTQLKPGDPQLWPGSWTYSDSKRARPGDNSNTQFALLGLSAASEVGVAVKPSVWTIARSYWERSQKRDGSWAYTPDSTNSTASMTCAGVSSLIISGLRRFESQELLQGAAIESCGKGAVNGTLQAGIDWLATHFHVDQNIGAGQQWTLYYLYGLERAGRLAGLRLFGQHDWYRAGAEVLVREQNKLNGSWEGKLIERNPVMATSFALLFLAKGRAPILINKLRHLPADDWDNDPDDVRNIVNMVSRDWNHLLTWQTINTETATVADLLRAPMVFLNGHNAPELTASEWSKLREYIERGGTIFAEACCGDPRFDKGFTTLMAEMFPTKEDQLRPLGDDHPIWRARHQLTPDSHPLLGIHRGGRIAVIYSPRDLSCYWNQSEKSPANPAVIKAIRVGQNVIDHVTGRRLPPDKLSDR